MNAYLEKFIVARGTAKLDALKMIDLNKKGFLMVCDKENGNYVFCGTLTDGDLRRAIIRGEGTDTSIDTAYTRHSLCLTVFPVL